MKVCYLAHPVSGNIEANLLAAKEWYRFCVISFPKVAFVANWIVNAEIFDDNQPLQREAGLVACEAVIKRCDAMLMVGPRVSDGMRRESKHAPIVFDCTTTESPPSFSFDEAINIQADPNWERFTRWAQEPLGDHPELMRTRLMDATMRLRLIRELCREGAGT